MITEPVNATKTFDQNYATWKGWRTLFKCSQDDHMYFSGEFQSLPVSGKKILEIGFGGGTFMRWSKDEGAQVSGCELIKELCDTGSSLGFDTRHGDLSTFANELGLFDYIVAFDVLEHISPADLLPFFQQVHAMLTPSGTFVARVPNAGSPWGLPYQYGDITHISLLSPGRFQQLAQASEFRLAKCGNAFRVRRQGRKLTDTIRFFAMDLAALVFNKLGGFWRLPLDPNIVAVLKKR